MVQQRLESKPSCITRRNLLKATGGSTILLAGCSGSDKKGSTSNGSKKGGKPVDDTLSTTGVGGPPTNYQFNPWAIGQGEAAWHLNRLIWEQFAWFNIAKDKFVNMLADSWEWDGKDFVVHLPKERTWSNGDDLVAQDFKIQFELEKHLGPGGLGTDDIWPYTKEIVADNEKTVRFKLKKAYNQLTMEMMILKRSSVTPKALYGDFYKRLGKASSDDERQKVLDDITKFSVGPASNGKNPVVTHSPWGFEKATQQRFLMKIRESGHELLDKYNFPHMEYRPLSQNSEMKAVLTDDLDTIMRWSLGSPSYFKQLPEHGHVWHWEEGRGEGILFNFGEDSPFKRGNRNLRQAIAHIIDPKPIAKNAGGPYRDPIYITSGLSPSEFDKWIGKDNNFNRYDSKDKAAQLLRDAGFTKRNGTWKKPNGETFRPEGISDASHPDWVATGQTIVNQLKNFGIQAQQTPLESTTYSNRFDSGDFQMVFGAETAADNRKPSPFFDYSQNWRAYGTERSGRSQGTLYPANDPVKIPPVNKPNAKPTMEVVPNDILDEILTATSEEEAKEPVRKAAWLQNYDLQMIDLQNGAQHSYITRDDWTWPSDDQLWGKRRKAQNIVYHCIRMGEVQAKTK